MSSTKRWWRLNEPLPKNFLQAQAEISVALEAKEQATMVQAMAKATQVVVVAVAMLAGLIVTMVKVLELVGVDMLAMVLEGMEQLVMVAVEAMVQE
jgi:hypothetical protein